MSQTTKYFLFKLIPPRPTFAQDMYEAEGKVMQEHAAYWADLADKRTAVVFGPVLDPKGVWGVAIFEAEDEGTASDIAKNDPTLRSGTGFTSEVYPMGPAIVRR